MTVHSEELQELGDLTRTIFASKVPPERLKELEQGGYTWDERLWAELCQAGITSVPLSEDIGGMGFGLPAICAVVQAQGHHVAPVPLWSSLLGHRVISLSEMDYTELLGSAMSGETRVTLAIEEAGLTPVDAPVTRASSDGTTWVLNGVKIAVPHLQSATHFLASAATADGLGLFLVERNTSGQGIEILISTDLDEVGVITFEDTPASYVGGAELVQTLLDEAYIVLASLQLGLGLGALELTAKYVSNREQFGRPIGSFQAVQHQLADALIGLDAVELSILQALAHHENGDPKAGRAAKVASWWGRTAGTTALYTCQHVHGGIGVDVDYPLHRFYLWARQAENTLGNAEELLEAIGDDLVKYGATL